MQDGFKSRGRTVYLKQIDQEANFGALRSFDQFSLAEVSKADLTLELLSTYNSATFLLSRK